MVIGMGARAAVAGASGYAGGELLRLLLGHPSLQIGPVAGGSSVGRPVTDLHPHLPQLAGTTFAETTPEVLAEADVVFLALPHGQSAALAAALPPDLPVVDLGADHRLAAAQDWARFYDTPYAGVWPYGLPELFRGELAGATRIAAPVGQARTQAGPPLIPEHMSHLIARFGVSGLSRFSFHFLLGSPGPGPAPKNSQASRFGLRGGTLSMRMTP
jgi:N-acetyl-gamma-glutamyl-phosphate reductase